METNASKTIINAFTGIISDLRYSRVGEMPLELLYASTRHQADSLVSKLDNLGPKWIPDSAYRIPIVSIHRSVADTDRVSYCRGPAASHVLLTARCRLGGGDLLRGFD